jgi:hypothetical protein
MQRISKYVGRHHLALVALFFALSGGVAWAADTIGSADIIDGQVKTADIGDAEVKEADVGQGAVTSAEVKNDSIANGDVAPNSLASGRVADGSLTGTDVANNSIKGADVDESTLDVGDAGRAYARVSPDCDILSNCPVDQSKGISGATHEATGVYCVTAPGIDSQETAAAVTVDFSLTSAPNGQESAMTSEESGCGSGDQGFLVSTRRQPDVTIDGETVAGVAEMADNIAFTIVIP